jgi:hypothetical protein
MGTRTFSLMLPAACMFLVWPLRAQDTGELLNRLRQMENRIQALEAEVQALKQQQAAPAAAAVAEPAPPPEAPPRLGGAGGASAKALNPDIAVIGNFTGGAGNQASRPTPGLEMHETEISLQEVIDPYARADIFLSFGRSGVELEEGYLTFTSLPAHLQVRAGKMRAAFGKVNTMHSHAMPWVDRPLVTQDLLAGEEGLNDEGLSLSRILPAPKGLFLEGTAQLFRGESEGLFTTRRRSDLASVEHLRSYVDLSESTNLDLGGSFARGRSPFGDGWTRIYGIDATLRWKPLQRSIYQSFTARSELIWSRTVVDTSTSRESNAVLKPFGYYVAADYQIARRWFAGGRFDRSQRGACVPTVPETSYPCEPDRAGSLLRDTGGSLLLTYWPSEFSQIRGQLRRTRYGEKLTANELLFQFLFSIGAHGAHPF